MAFPCSFSSSSSSSFSSSKTYFVDVFVTFYFKHIWIYFFFNDLLCFEIFVGCLSTRIKPPTATRNPSTRNRQIRKRKWVYLGCSIPPVGRSGLVFWDRTDPTRTVVHPLCTVYSPLTQGYTFPLTKIN
jgi:hypothetical protein